MKRKDLLDKGYLPENLPPVFRVQTLGDYVDAELSAKQYLSESKQLTRLARYNATKRGHQRRLFSIPNPLSYIDVASFLSNNWSTIAASLSSSPLSISTPTIDQSSFRSIAITPHSQIPLLKFRRLSTANYIVRTDIARFFPSIYTHSIPWAMHGKIASKVDRNPKSKNILFNRLDQIIRDGQDGQTVGIPVGPDSSRIIAELIACAIDRQLIMRLKTKNLSMVRHVDDVWIGCQSRDEADKLLYTYRECLRDYELDINELKTSIISSTEDINSNWPTAVTDKLRHEIVPGQFAKRRDESLLSAIEDIFSTAHKLNDDALIKHAIRIIDDGGGWSRNWSTLEHFLLRCAVNYPHSIDYVARVMAWQKRRNCDIDLAAWKAIVRQLIVLHGRLGNDSEVCWALWMAKELKLSLTSDCTRAVWSGCGPLPMMMTFDLAKSKLTRWMPTVSEINQYVGQGTLFGSHWILVYETVAKGWLDKGDWTSFANHDFMIKMLDNSVSFYDLDALPTVLQDVDDGHWKNVRKAIEERVGDYEDDSDEGPDDDEDLPHLPEPRVPDR